MNAIAIRNTWHADGLRWVAGLFLAAADRLESPSRADPSADDHALFDSDAYLAEVRDRVLARYY
jgi:hypothetical protein